MVLRECRQSRHSLGGNAVRRKYIIFGLHSTPANTTHVPLKTAFQAVFAYKEFFCRTCRQKNRVMPFCRLIFKIQEYSFFTVCQHLTVNTVYGAEFHFVKVISISFRFFSGEHTTVCLSLSRISPISFPLKPNSFKSSPLIAKCEIK